VIPDPQYAKSDDGLHIAYKVIGDGPTDLLWPEPFTSVLEHMEQIPQLASFVQRLGSTHRLIAFDPRGVGLSDRVPDELLPSLEVRMADAIAVMNAVGSERAAIFGWADTGPLAILFAATHPERTTALFLYETGATSSPRVDYPFGWEEGDWDAWMADIEQRWGSQEFADDYFRLVAPSLATHTALRKTWASVLRLGSSPGAALAVTRMERETDVRHILPAIQVPTLVLYRSECTMYTVAEGRHIADHIPGAKFIELPGADHLPWAGDSDALINEIERFSASVRHEEAVFDRVLATVLFTDIVGSTETAVARGDRDWKELLERHHAVTRAMIARYRGAVVDTAGDGFFATFDGPARAVRCALAITDALRPVQVEIREGLHTGEVETIDGKIGGVAVNIGARVGACASPSEVLVSQTVKDLVAGSGLVFEDRGVHALKGIPDEWRLYSASSD
jgi:class 3 adenylate cyclase/pimeloyl-ACP methyl ester carboxylesterase